jgi:hypothetical protein
MFNLISITLSIDHLTTSENGGILKTEFAKLIFKIMAIGKIKNTNRHSIGGKAI